MKNYVVLLNAKVAPTNMPDVKSQRRYMLEIAKGIYYLANEWDRKKITFDPTIFARSWKIKEVHTENARLSDDF